MREQTCIKTTNEKEKMKKLSPQSKVGGPVIHLYQQTENAGLIVDILRIIGKCDKDFILYDFSIIHFGFVATRIAPGSALRALSWQALRDHMYYWGLNPNWSLKGKHPTHCTSTLTLHIVF